MTAFKKLLSSTKEVLETKGIEAPNSFQNKAIPKIKSGVDVFGIAPEGEGKTTTLIVNTIQKLKGEAQHDVPRAIIFVKDKEAALQLETRFKEYMVGTNLRIYCVYEEPVIDHQLGEIYPGLDIVIATPKRLNKIYFLNGINLSKLQLIGVEDAEFLSLGTNTTLVARISESVNKCQYIVFAKQMDKKMERLQQVFMEKAVVVKG